METDKLREIIKDYYEKEIPEVIEREIELKLPEKTNRCIVLIGPRRSGKTYLLYQLMKKLKKDKRIYINFEDIRFENENYKIIIDIVEHFSILTNNKEPVLFLDEIQNIERWEKGIRHLIDKNLTIFLTGSSSKLLSREIATQLRGRSIPYYVFPFSFREFLKAKNISIDKFIGSKEKVDLLRYLEEYIEFGSYPEVVLTKDRSLKEKIIKDIWEITILKDIVERYGFKNIKVLKMLLKGIIESKELSIHKFYNTLKSLNIKVSKNTLYEYLNALEEIMVVFPIHNYSATYKNIEKSIPKIYLVDTGLFMYSKDEGRKMENVVFMHLKRNENKSPFQEIYYYRTKKGKEIDFLIRDKKEMKIIEVCFSFDNKHKQKLIEAMEELSINNCLCITWDEERIIKEGNKEIKLVPLWKWLLEI